ncbi:hypothetical protein ES705_05077 [subsurface metagenome]
MSAPILIILHTIKILPGLSYNNYYVYSFVKHRCTNNLKIEYICYYKYTIYFNYNKYVLTKFIFFANRSKKNDITGKQKNKPGGEVMFFKAGMI